MGKFLAGLLLLLALAPRLRSAEPVDERGEPAIIDAPTLRFEKPMAYAEGDRATNVVIRYQGAVLQADKVRFNTETKDAWAEGHVRLNRDGQEWVAPAIFYNFETRELKTDEVRGLIDPLIVRGEAIEQTGTNRYAVARTTATTCDYESPHYRLEGTRSEIFPGDRVIIYNVTLRFGDVPVFWFPVMIFSLSEDTQPVALSVGSGSRWGMYALVSTYWQLQKDVKLTVHLDERTERGFGAGVDLDYKLGTNGLGSIKTYYLNDADPIDPADRTNTPPARPAANNIDHHRYRAQLRHKQGLPADLELTVDLNLQSDEDVLDDFFPTEFREEKEPQSVVDLTRRGPNHSLSILTRPQLNDYYAEVERLPELTWSVNRVRLGPTPLFYEQEARVGYQNNEAGDTRDPVFRGEALRAHTFHQLLVPTRLFGWLSVVPRAGLGGTYYSNSPQAAGDGENVQRAIQSVGVDTSFKVSRTWPEVANARLNIRGLRHIVQPFANYQLVPRPDNGTNEVFQFDTVRQTTLLGGDQLSLTRYSPLEFPAFNTIDAIDKLHVVRFGLQQKLQTQRTGQPHDVLELTGWTDYRVEESRAGQDDFSELFGTTRLRPFDWLVLSSFARYDMHEGVLPELNNEARVVRGDRWSVGVGTRWLKDDSNLVSLSAVLRLGRNWVAQTYQRFDMEDGTWEAQEYVLRQETHDWLITYGLRYDSERIQDDELLVFVAVTLRALPSVGISAGRVGLGVN